MRSQAISFMCQLSDRDLRLVATKNTTELMYESFKELTNYCIVNNNNNNNSSEINNLTKQQIRAANLVFKLDRDGLSLAYKYLL